VISPVWYKFETWFRPSGRTLSRVLKNRVLSRTFRSKRERGFIFSMAFPAYSGPRPLIQFRNHISQTVWLLGWVISPPQGRCLNTGQHRINAYTHQTSMPWLGFEPTIPASEQAKSVHALDGATTMTGEGRRLLEKIMKWGASKLVPIHPELFGTTGALHVMRSLVVSRSSPKQMPG
jgi:hypothetical protein